MNTLDIALECHTIFEYEESPKVTIFPFFWINLNANIIDGFTNNNCMIALCENGILKIIPLESSNSSTTFTLPGNWTTAINSNSGCVAKISSTFQQSDNIFAIGGPDGLLSIIDIRSSTANNNIYAHDGTIDQIHFSIPHNPSAIFTAGSYDGWVRFWDLRMLQKGCNSIFERSISQNHIFKLDKDSVFPARAFSLKPQINKVESQNCIYQHHTSFSDDSSFFTSTINDDSICICRTLDFAILHIISLGV